MNIPCRGFLIILIVSNFKTDNAYFSQLRTSTTCFCTILSFVITKRKTKQTCLCLIYNAFQVCHYGHFGSYCAFNLMEIYHIWLQWLLSILQNHVVKMRLRLRITSLDTHFVNSIYIYISITRHQLNFTLRVQRDKFLATFMSTLKAN